MQTSVMVSGCGTSRCIQKHFSALETCAMQLLNQLFYTKFILNKHNKNYNINKITLLVTNLIRAKYNKNQGGVSLNVGVGF